MSRSDEQHPTENPTAGRRPPTRPILFSAPMIREILADRETQTRRVVKPQPVPVGTIADEDFGAPSQTFVERGVLRVAARWGSHPAPCPYGQPGDRLWVKETYALSHRDDNTEATPKERDAWDWPPVYRADGEDQGGGWTRRMPSGVERWIAPPWRPSIHMPRWASRLTLEVTSVRVERLHDITEEDARAEGIREVTKDGSVRKFCVYDHTDHSSTPWAEMPRTACEAFSALWRSINGPESWEANPWVWAVGFKRVEVPRG